MVGYFVEEDRKMHMVEAIRRDQRYIPLAIRLQRLSAWGL